MRYFVLPLILVVSSSALAQNEIPAPSRTVRPGYLLANSSGSFFLCDFLDAENGEPLFGTVSIGWTPPEHPATTRIHATSRHLRRGPLALQIQRKGIHVIHFSAPHRKQVSVLLKVDQLSGQRFHTRVRLRRASGFRFRIVDESDKPISGASARLLPSNELPREIRIAFQKLRTVWTKDILRRPEGLLMVTPTFVESLHWGSTQLSCSDRRGNLSLDGLSAGRYRFEISAPGFVATRTEFLPFDGKKTQSVRIKLKRALSLTVQVRDEAGHPLSGILVTFPDGAKRMTDSKGECHGYSPDGEQVLHIAGFGRQSKHVPVDIVENGFVLETTILQR